MWQVSGQSRLKLLTLTLTSELGAELQHRNMCPQEVTAPVCWMYSHGPRRADLAALAAVQALGAAGWNWWSFELLNFLFVGPSDRRSSKSESPTGPQQDSHSRKLYVPARAISGETCRPQYSQCSNQQSPPLPHIPMYAPAPDGTCWTNKKFKTPPIPPGCPQCLDGC